MAFLLFLSGSYSVEFEKFPYCFPQWLHQFAFLPTEYKDLLFSRSSPVFVICVLFDDSHSDRFFFPSWLAVLSIFSYTCCPPAFPLWKNVYSVFLPSFKQFVFCDVELYEFLYMLYIISLSIIEFANIFYHSVSCLFILFMISFAVQNLFSLIRSHLFIFVFYFHYSRRWIEKELAVVGVKECSACVFL